MGAVSVNKRAYFDYEILERYEAGIELLGHEVKSIKTGHINLAGAFVIVKNGEAWLLNATVPPYQPKNTPTSYDPQRTRKLLLRKSEIKELIGQSSQKGLTIVPLKAYLKNRKVKLEIGVARHKKLHDKRELIREREEKRRIERFIKEP